MSEIVAFTQDYPEFTGFSHPDLHPDLHRLINYFNKHMFIEYVPFCFRTILGRDSQQDSKMDFKGSLNLLTLYGEECGG